MDIILRRGYKGIEAISKNGFWIKIAAGQGFPAKRDFSSVGILFVGHKPQEYIQ